MAQFPQKRITRLADSAIGVNDEDRTVEMDRETLDESSPKHTNESAVHETDGSPKSEINRNDYERALPRHYRLVKMIGRGGMSEVFLAEDERLGRNVAIKFLNSEFRRDPDRMMRFYREARAASALNHPNILTIHDIGENGGVQFIVSEFVDGETLGVRIAKGKLPLPEAIRISTQIASALAASHNAGIVHRDIKPDNVMIRRDGSVKVLDFGLAKETGSIVFDSNGNEAQTLETAATSPGLILGTPQYMSPEQARGRPLDARTDIFSFGVILFETVTGKQPFPGTTMVDIIAAVIGKEPKPLEEFLDDPPELLSRIVDKSLRKNKDERYGTMEHLLSDLRDLQREITSVPYFDRTTKGGQVRNTRPNTIRSFLGEPPVRKNLVMLLLVALPVLALAAWWIASRGPASEQPNAAGSMRMVPITTWSSGTGELAAAASLSADARMIAFAATKTGATEIWVKPVAGGEPIQITRNGFYNQYPVWSPNGQDIAFFSSRERSNGIWRTSFTGGEQVQLASGVAGSARPVFWSKSGRIYFQEGMELFTVDERTGERTSVTNFASKNLKPRTIEISPDEKTLAYSIREDGPWSIYVSDIALERPARIASSAEQIDQIALNTDGSSVFYSCSVDGAYQVFRSGIGYNQPVQLSNGNLDFFVQDVSTDGSRVLYGSVSETSDLWRVDVSDAKQTPLVNEVAAEFWADVSPDGKSIVYQSVNQADRPYRGSINLRTSGSPASITLSQEGFAPRFSDDGQWAAYFRRSDAGISIWRVRANGGDAMKLADGSITPPPYSVTPYLKIGGGQIEWSPDNSGLAYVAKNDSFSNIWFAASDAPSQKALTKNQDPADNYCCPLWTRDGKTIVYTSELTISGSPRKMSFRLWTADLVTSEQRVVYESGGLFRLLGLSNNGAEAVLIERTDPKEQGAIAKATDVVAVSLKSGIKREIRRLSDAYFNNIHLSDDGTSLAFVTRAENVSKLWTVPLNAGTPRNLVAETDPKILFSTLSWSRDGRSIVFGKQTRTNLLSMLSN